MIRCLLILPGILFPVLLLYWESKKNYRTVLLFKTLSSLVFVLMGVLSYEVSGRTAFALMILTGLVFGAAGDVLLSLRNVFPKHGGLFFIGGGSFFIGHLFYLVALSSKLRAGGLFLPALLASAAVSSVLVTLLLRRIRAGRSFSVLCAVYMCAVTSLAVFGVFCFFLRPDSAGALLFMIGGIFFAASDTVLVENMWNPAWSFKKCCALIALYYAGQLLIAAGTGL